MISIKIPSANFTYLIFDTFLQIQRKEPVIIFCYTNTVTKAVQYDPGHPDWATPDLSMCTSNIDQQRNRT